jgi:hypothetical protein
VEAFYSTIFVAVLALFGLLVAALIYVAQTVQDRYSTRLAQRLLKGRLSWTFWLLGFLTLVLASLGLFLQAYPTDQTLPFGLSLCATINNLYYGAATLSGVFLTLLFFILTLRSYSRLLSPLTVLEEMARGLTPRTVRDIALLRLHNEVPPPQIDDAELRELINRIRGAPNPVSQPEIQAKAAKKRRFLGQLLGQLRRPVHFFRKKPSEIEEIKKGLAARERVGKLEDPLADLFEYGLSAIGKNNILAWRVFLLRLVDVFSQSARSGMLTQDAQIPFLGDTLLLQGLNRLSEEIEIAQRYSLLVQLNDATKDICDVFASADAWRRVFPFLTFFQEIGAGALSRNDSILFKSSVRLLTSIGILSIQSERDSQVFDDVCRKIGWLGERLILHGIEETPIMPSGNEAKELQEVTEGIYRLSDALREGKTDKYPLILRDAIEVICDQALKKNEPKKFEETILSLFATHKDLAEYLVGRESVNAEAYLWLVLHYFKPILTHYDLSDYRELKRDIFSWVGILARETIAHNQEANRFWGDRISGPKDLQGLIISFMVGMGSSDDWDAAMWEVSTKSYAHIDGAWAFIKRAGAELHSNFGMMFDPGTGEDYASDDPRRRL